MQPSWPPPPPDLTLPKQEVHVWQVSLEQPLSIINRLRQTLSGEELARAKRFYFEKDRRQYIVTRGALRAVLGRYLDQPPGALRFGYTEFGKPFLPATGPAATPPNFNVSHSGTLALFALTYGRAIGIDLEHIRSMPDAAKLAERFFSAREVAVFQALPPAQQQAAFFNCWTRKEAYIKAIGEGLSHPLDAFDVAFAPGEAAALLAVRSDPRQVEHWSLHALMPASGYVAALVVEGHGWQLKTWRWSGNR